MLPLLFFVIISFAADIVVWFIASQWLKYPKRIAGILVREKYTKDEILVHLVLSVLTISVISDCFSIIHPDLDSISWCFVTTEYMEYFNISYIPIYSVAKLFAVKFLHQITVSLFQTNFENSYIFTKMTLLLNPCLEHKLT